MTRVLTAGLVLLVMGASAAAAEPIGFVANLAETQDFKRLDLETGAATSIPGLGGFTDLAFSPSGVLYGVLVMDPGESALVTIDPAAQTMQVVAPLDQVPALTSGITFDASGSLWLIRDDGLLFAVDPATGEMTLVADTGRQLDGLTACGHRLFAVDERSQPPAWGRLVEIDPGSGAVIPRGPPHEHLDSESIGLDFDASGRLWAVHNSVDPLIPIPGNLIDVVVEIDPASGLPISRLLFNDGGEGLAIGPPLAACPEIGQPEVIPTLSGGAMLAAIALFLLLGLWALHRS